MTMKINGGELRSAGVTTTAGNARVKDNGKAADAAAAYEKAAGILKSGPLAARARLEQHVNDGWGSDRSHG